MSEFAPTPTHYKILRLAGAFGPASRAELITRTGLSKAAMSGLVRDLVDAGLLREGREAGAGGRASALLAHRGDGAYFVGVSMASDPAIVALVDFGGTIVASLPIARSDDPAAFATAIAAALPQLLESGGIARARVLGLGVALSGLVDETQATCIKSTLLGWQDVPLAPMVAEATGLATFVENDAKALAVAERLFGQARGLHSFTLIWLGPGIGAAHFVHDRLYRGAHGGAGEIAHATVEIDGLPCRCGKRGCLDTVASLTAIRDAAREAGLEADGLDGLERLAAEGSSAAIRLLHRAGSALGLAIAQIIQINDPQMVLVSHGEPRFDGLMATVMLQTAEANVLPRLSGETPLRTLAIRPDGWAVAAASVATQAFLHGAIPPAAPDSSSDRRPVPPPAAALPQELTA